MYNIGIDLGGTNLRAGVVDEAGHVLGRASVATPRGTAALVEAIASAVDRAASSAGLTLSDIRTVGLACAGSVDPEEGTVLHAFNLGLDHVPLAGLVSERLGLIVRLENDANAAALGEFLSGAGRGSSSLVLVTLGTGLGVGAVLSGALYTGFNHAGMEGGHMVIHRGGRPCTCGRRGCWEAYVSATGLIASTRQAMAENPDSALWKLCPTLEQADGETAFTAAQQGDAAAQAVVADYESDLACGVVNLVNLLQPEVLCIGGGVSGQGEGLLVPIQAVLDEEEFTRDGPHRTRLRIAQLGNEAGLVGAALLPGGK